MVFSVHEASVYGIYVLFALTDYEAKRVRGEVPELRFGEAGFVLVYNTFKNVHFRGNKIQLSPSVQYKIYYALNGKKALEPKKRKTSVTNPKLTPSTRVSAKNAIKSFYSANWFALEPACGEDITQPEPKQRSPEMKDLEDLDKEMISRRDKAILWFLASAPFRKGTLGKLKRKDLVPTGDKDVPYQIIVGSKDLKGKGEGKYSRLKQVCFLHWYAVEKLREYEQELVDKKITVNDESPIFVEYGGRNPERKVRSDIPLRDFERVFRRASFRAWHDLDEKRFSPQDMRDFVQSKLESAKVPINMIKPIMAHKIKDVEYHYSSHQVSELMENFKSALPWLIPESIEQVKAETQKKLKEEQDELVNLQYDNINLKKDINKLTTDQEATKRRLNSIEEGNSELFKLIETKEDLLEVRELYERLRTKKIERQIQKEAEEQEKYEQENKPNELTAEQIAEMEKRTEEYKKMTPEQLAEEKRRTEEYLKQQQRKTSE